MFTFSSSLDLQFPQRPPEEAVNYEDLTAILTFIFQRIAEELGTVHYVGAGVELLTPQYTIKQQNQNKIWVLATEGINAGKLIHLSPDSNDKLVCQKASVDNHPRGFALESVAAGEYAEVCIMAGLNSFQTNLIPGSVYYVHELIPGEVSTVVPRVGYMKPIGIALSDTELYFTLQL